VTTSTKIPTHPRMVDQAGVRFGLASGALVLTLMAVAALPLDLGGTAFVALLTTALLSTALSPGAAVGLGVQAWAYYTGFFENQYGALTVTSHDLLDLVGFVIGTLALAHLFRTPVKVAVRSEDR
jgi:hypothetical protein